MTTKTARHDVEGGAKLEVPSVTLKEGQTDIANAHRFVNRFGANVRYVHIWKMWLYWDGKRWCIDNSGRVRAKSHAISCDTFAEAARFESRDGAKHAWRTGQKAGIDAMLSLAADLLSISPDELDADPWLLNCQNGTVDLRDGTLKRHRQTDFITKITPTDYDPDAKAPKLEETLTDVFLGSSQLIDSFARQAGYFLTGDVSEHKVFIWNGNGANGKSTVIEAISHAMGSDYAITQPSDFLMARKSDEHPTSIADLHGRRLAICAETGEDRRLNEPFLKQLSGGDTLAGRAMKKDYFRFAPTHKIVVTTNHLPRVSGTDHGLWRRVEVLPFERTFMPSEQDKGLPAKLKEEAAGILAWMVRGCREWRLKGLNPSKEVRDATATYRTSEDVLERFIDDRCVVGPDERVQSSKLHKAFDEWCRESGEQTMANRKLTSKLRDRGFDDEKIGCKFILGIGLQDLEVLEDWNPS